MPGPPESAPARSPRVCGDPQRGWKEAPLCQQVFIVHNQMMRCADRLVAHLGLTSSRWLMLGALEQYEKPPTLTELSGHALLSVQNVSRMVASMEADGLLERFSRDGAGRSVFVRMTPKGAEIKERARAEAERFAEGFLAGFAPEEVAAGEAMFDRLIANLERMESELTAQGDGA